MRRAKCWPPVNVEGTRNAVAFARAAGAGFLHVSTAYVCGTREGAIAEGAGPRRHAFHQQLRREQGAGRGTGGGERRAVCRWRAHPLCWAIMQAARSANFHRLCNVFRLMARGKVGVLPARETATVNLVPICHVAEGIARIAERFAAAQGGYFHLVAGQPLPVAKLAHGVARVEHFPAPQVVDPEDFRCGKPARRQNACCWGGCWRHSVPYFTARPAFRRQRISRAYRPGLSCRPTPPGSIG